MNPLQVGDTAQRRRVFTRDDVVSYRSLSGDPGLRFGPGDPDAVPGPLLAGMISDLLGTSLPGRGTMWLKQTLRFPGTARTGDEIVAEVRITMVRPDKGLVDLACACRIGGEPVLEGDSLVLVPDLEDRYDR